CREYRLCGWGSLVRSSRFHVPRRKTRPTPGLATSIDTGGLRLGTRNLEPGTAVMVYLSRIYTKAGDAGETALGDGRRVPKDHARVDAYGQVDELNAVLGLLAAYCPD